MKNNWSVEELDILCNLVSMGVDRVKMYNGEESEVYKKVNKIYSKIVNEYFEMKRRNEK